MERPETRTESLPDSVSEPITSIDALSGGRAKHTAVHNFLTPEDFINLALEGGFRASKIPQEHDTSVITLVREHFRSVALLRSRVPNSKLFASALRRAIVRGAAQGSPGQVGRAQRRRGSPHLHRGLGSTPDWLDLGTDSIYIDRGQSDGLTC